MSVRFVRFHRGEISCKQAINNLQKMQESTHFRTTLHNVNYITSTNPCSLIVQMRCIAQKNLLLGDGLPRKQAEIPQKHLKTY
jgi:hypothetical protein